jgi:hypothetical protein
LATAEEMADLLLPVVADITEAAAVLAVILVTEGMEQHDAPVRVLNLVATAPAVVAEVEVIMLLGVV